MMSVLESLSRMISMGKEWVRENEKRAEFQEALYQSRGRKNGLYTGLVQEWFERERDDWLEQARIAKERRHYGQGQRW